MMTPPRLCLVRWRDAHGTKSEDTLDTALKIHKPAIYWSVGVLLKSDAAGVTIAQDYGLPLEEEGVTYRTRSFINRELIEEEFDIGPLIRRPRKAPATNSVTPLPEAH